MDDNFFEELVEFRNKLKEKIDKAEKNHSDHSCSDCEPKEKVKYYDGSWDFELKGEFIRLGKDDYYRLDSLEEFHLFYDEDCDAWTIACKNNRGAIFSPGFVFFKTEAAARIKLNELMELIENG